MFWVDWLIFLQTAFGWLIGSLVGCLFVHVLVVVVLLIGWYADQLFAFWLIMFCSSV